MTPAPIQSADLSDTSPRELREKDRIQGMVRSINQYRNGDPKAICAGSDAQILYAITDARHDVLVLWDFAVAAGTKLDAKDRRIEALEAALASQMHFLGEVAGTCLGLAMSGKDHPDPDGALMGLFTTAQSLTVDVRAALSGKEGQS